LRVKFFVSIVLTLGLASCYAPKLGDPGFFCHPTDNPACPDGQSCFRGRCVAVVGFGDGSPAPQDSGTSGPPGSTPDLGASDLGASDLSTKPACAPTGGDCTYHNNAACCSNYCVYKTNTCK
jgi:hypothetical protein